MVRFTHGPTNLNELQLGCNRLIFVGSTNLFFYSRVFTHPICPLAHRTAILSLMPSTIACFECMLTTFILAMNHGILFKFTHQTIIALTMQPLQSTAHYPSPSFMIALNFTSLSLAFHNSTSFTLLGPAPDLKILHASLSLINLPVIPSLVANISLSSSL